MLVEILHVKTVLNPDTNCWEWVGGRDNSGYGVLSHKKAHRIAYEEFIGAIAVGRIGSFTGRKHSEETIAKMTGRTLSEETKAKISATKRAKNAERN